MARSKLAFNDRVTVGLRAAIIALDVIAFGFLLGAYFQHVNYFYTNTGGFADLISLAPVLVSFLWTVLSVSLNYFKGRYHPGVDVGMELLACCVIAGTVWWLILWIGMNGWYYGDQCSQYDYSSCTEFMGDILLASEIIASVAIIVCGLLHFTLFVKACRETHLRRRIVQEAKSDDRELHIVVVTNGKEIELA